jgi:hypothetical protein
MLSWRGLTITPLEKDESSKKTPSLHAADWRAWEVRKKIDRLELNITGKKIRRLLAYIGSVVNGNLSSLKIKGDNCANKNWHEYSTKEFHAAE